MISSSSSSYKDTTEDSKKEDVLQKYLDEQIEQLSKEVDATEGRSQTWFTQGLLPISLGCFTIIFGILIGIPPKGQIIVGPIAIVAGSLITIIGIFVSRQIRDANKQKRSNLLDKLFEIKKISKALEFVSNAPEKTKDRFQVLLVQELLQSLSGQKISVPELEQFISKDSTTGSTSALYADGATTTSQSPIQSTS